LDSVINQSFQEFEITLVNDGSTDDGLHFISNNYSNKISLINQENQGVSAARNTGISYAKYPFIAFLDADDCWHKQYLQKVNEVIESEVNIKIIGSHYSRKKEFLESEIGVLNFFKFENYFKSALKNIYFFTSSTIVNKDFFNENKGFNISLKRGEDIDVWIRAVYSGGNAFYITNTLVYYSNEDPNQITNKKFPIKYSIVGTINMLDYHKSPSMAKKDFEKFISIFVYSNLYPYFYDYHSYLKSKLILKKIKCRFFLLDLIYMFPLVCGINFLKSSRFEKLIRMYIKFVIQYLIK
jgi:glycosyltransferase involved in cell wall biosynthesis